MSQSAIENVINDCIIACEAYNAGDWQHFMRVGRKVEAIKAVRHSCNFGLKEAKDAVEYWVENGYTAPTNNKATVRSWNLPSSIGANVKRRVVEHYNGNFTVETVTLVHYDDLGALFAAELR